MVERTLETRSAVIHGGGGAIGGAGARAFARRGAQVFLADIADFAGMNRAWDAWVVPGQAPSRATVEARLANPAWKVEIVVTAVV
jgi:NAD(P)-dependent dehydrogenase (short-subunit alcohol dehydrogenase family)